MLREEHFLSTVSTSVPPQNSPKFPVFAKAINAFKFRKFRCKPVHHIKGESLKLTVEVVNVMDFPKGVFCQAAIFCKSIDIIELGIEEGQNIDGSTLLTNLGGPFTNIQSLSLTYIRTVTDQEYSPSCRVRRRK
jgi:hypothetical protein